MSELEQWIYDELERRFTESLIGTSGGSQILGIVNTPGIELYRLDPPPWTCRGGVWAQW